MLYEGKFLLNYIYMLLGEHEPLRSTWLHPRFQWGSCYQIFGVLCCGLLIIIYPFVLFQLVIVMSSFSISHCNVVLFNLRLLIGIPIWFVQIFLTLYWCSISYRQSMEEHLPIYIFFQNHYAHSSGIQPSYVV